MSSAPLVAFFVALVSGLSVEGDASCVTEAALRRDLEALLPPEVELDEVAVAVHVEPSEPATGLEVKLSVDGPELPPLRRTFHIERAGCGSLGRLLARVVARHVAPLSRAAADEGPSAEPAPREEREPRRVVQANPMLEGPRPEQAFLLRPQAGVGMGAGVWPFHVDLRLELGFALGAPDGPQLLATTRLSLSQPLALGDGQALLAHGVLGLGATVGFDLDGLTLAPRVLAVAGPALAWGNGFQRGELAVLPHLGIVGGVTLYTRSRIFIDLGSEIGLTPAVLGTRDGERTETSPVLLYVQVGLAWEIPLRGATPSRPADPVKESGPGGDEPLER